MPNFINMVYYYAFISIEALIISWNAIQKELAPNKEWIDVIIEQE